MRFRRPVLAPQGMEEGAREQEKALFPELNLLVAKLAFVLWALVVVGFLPLGN